MYYAVQTEYRTKTSGSSQKMQKEKIQQNPTPFIIKILKKLRIEETFSTL